MARLRDILLRFISSVENSGSFAGWALYFAAVVSLRNGLESLISEQRTLRSILLFSQYQLFYIASFFLAAIWLSVFAGDGKKSSRIAALGTGLVLLAPALDLLILGHGAPMGYLTFASFGKYLAAALSFGITIPFYSIGRSISPGIRIELIAIYIIIFLYVLLKRRSFFRALGAAYLFHVTLFLLPGSLTFLTAHLGKFFGAIFGGIFVGTRIVRPASLLTIMVAILGIAWLSLLDRRYVRSLLQCIRPVRLAHYGGMVIAGVWLGCSGSITSFLRLNMLDLIAFLMGYFALWLFAVLINDSYDKETDRLSNNARPVATGLLTSAEAKIFAWTTLVLGLIMLGSQRISAFKMAILFASCAYLYSVPPARTKRIPVLSTLTLALSSLAGALVGYAFAHTDIDKFPGGIAAAILIGVTLGFMTKDLKDIKGDRATGVMTIPTLLSTKVAKPLCAVLSAISILLIPILTGGLSSIPLATALILAAAAGIYIAFAKVVDERIPMGIYLVYASIYLALWYPFAKP